MQIDRLRYLLKKYIVDDISDLELEELSAMIQRMDNSIQEAILDDVLAQETEQYTIPEDRKKVIYDQIQGVISDSGKEDVRKSTIISFRHYLKYIAVVAILITGLFVLLWNRGNQPIETLKDLSAQVSLLAEDDIYLDDNVVPMVRLPDGQIRMLDESSEEVLLSTGVKVSRTADGELLYEVQRSSDAQRSSNMGKVVFSSPKGSTSRIILTDQTQVLLNSGSSLEYPVDFSEKERRVKLRGEAYFDVAHASQRPFFIETDKGPLVKVLGTAFNISAYPEDNATTTTLVEGSIQLLGAKHQLVLRPNEQTVARIDDAVLRKRTVSTEEFTSWKDGYFSFDGQSLQELLTKVQRWYDVEEVVYRGMSEDRFTGTFKRTKSLKSLLTKLERISDAKFEIRERRIVVMR